MFIKNIQDKNIGICIKFYKMKNTKIFTLLIFFLFSINGFSQVSENSDPNSLANLKKNPTFAKNYVYGVKMTRANAMGIVGDKLLAGQEVSDDDKTASLVNTYVAILNGVDYSHEDKVVVVNNYYGITNYPDAHVDGEFDKLMVKTRTLMMEGDLSGVRMPTFISKKDVAADGNSGW